eukprot:scaffold148870_cov37-Cyclotella_meneghiniana.AAC.1
MVEIRIHHPQPSSHPTFELRTCRGCLGASPIVYGLGDGYLFVLDLIDDVLMLHGVVWEDLELVGGVTAKDGVKCRNRVAFVMRRCEKMEDFYTDTSTIRLGADMLKAMETSTANNNIKEGMGRGLDE